MVAAANADSSVLHHNYDGGLMPKELKKPLIISGVFHVLVVVVLTIGMPYIAPDEPLDMPPIHVELFSVDEITQTTNVQEPNKAEDEKPVEQEQVQKKPERRIAPKMTEVAPPDLTQPEAAQPEDLAPLPPDESRPKETPPKIIAQKPRKKPAVKKEVTKVVEVMEPDKDFQSLLRNLTPSEESAPQVQKEKQSDNASETSGQIAPLGDRITVNERDAVIRQLSGCWNVMAGAKYAEDLVVAVRLYMNADRTVNRAIILDRGRYNNDPVFRAAADAAVRATRNPNCSPLLLPPDKYEQWKSIVINFDPRDML